MKFNRTYTTVLVALITSVVSLLISNVTIAQERIADLVLVGGNIYTVDQARPVAEAIAISKRRILAVGSNELVQKHIGDETDVIDLKGKFVMPGFIEGHAHFIGLGESRMMLNLQSAKTWSDIVQQVEEAAKTTPPTLKATRHPIRSTKLHRTTRSCLPMRAAT